MSTPFYDLASLVVVPSGYKASKVYAQKPLTTDGQLTFSRASTATRVNASGLIETVASNVPRLDYLGSTCPKLQLEPQRSNLALQSNDVTTSTTNVGYTATANNTTSPDGTANADRIMEDTSTLHLVQKQFSVGSTTDTYAVSFFVKANGRTSAKILYGLNGAPFSSVEATFNLTAGTITTPVGGNGGTAGTSKIENYGNDWYRVSITGVIGTAGTHYVRLQDTNGGAAGDPTKGFFVWGFQAELGSYSTSMVPTLGAAVTRLADACSKTGISSLIGQTEGTIFLQFDNRLLTSYPNEYPFQVIGSGGHQLWMRKESGGNTFTARLIVSSSTIWTFSSIPVPNGNNKIAISYKTGDSAFYLNGTQFGSTNTAAFSGSSFTDFNFNLNGASNPELILNQALLFKTRLTNAQLAELTTL